MSELLTHRPADHRLARLTPREHDVLRLLAEGRSNTAIAARLFLSISAVTKHINGIFTKPHLERSDDDNRRVRTALTYLQAR
ncbi:MAG: LuxR family transcription regulator [Amycolatopsis sp.]|nr:LuxR family transcription regulator [Amycolatopsis sp.]